MLGHQNRMRVVDDSRVRVLEAALHPEVYIYDHKALRTAVEMSRS